jgi:membrane protein DedA with SNARE-associated domain
VRLPTFIFCAVGFLALGPSIEHVQNWMQAGGYFVLFGVLFACGLGFPLPEDVPLMVAGALAHKGIFHLVPVAIFAWCGIIGGDLMLYHLGKKLGPGVTRLPVIGRHITKERLAKVEVQFQKYGIWVVAIGRLFAGVRGAMVVTAGTIRFNLVKFLIADGIAAIVSGGMFVALGWVLGKNLPALMSKVEHGKQLAFELLGLTIVALGVAWLIRQKLRRRAKAATGAEMPVPVDPGAPKLLPSSAVAGEPAELLRKGPPLADDLN